jgi:hypothetical protein
MSIQNLYPNISPTLSLDFANTKALDSRVTFARASTARAYDGRTVAKAEENLMLRSQEFDNVSWAGTTGLVITANAATAPDGTSTAEVINEGTSNGPHQTFQASFSYIAGQTYTFSVFAKKDTATVVQLVGQSTAFGSNAFANFDVDTGVLGTVGATATASITNAGNGWYRCVFTATATSTTTQAVGLIFLGNNDTNAARALSYTGTSRQLFLWGAQLEQRSAVTAYTPTTTQPITNYIPALQTAAAGVARFDHNPITGESLGLLIEEQRTNLLQRSEEFENSYWSKVNCSISANAVISPDGTLNADKLIANTNTATHPLFKASIISSGSIAVSVYAKAGEHSWVHVNESNSTAKGAYFNLSNGTLGTVGASASASITPVGNGWYRCSVVTTAATGSGIAIYPAVVNDSISFAGDGFSGIYIWGAQLEAGAFPTSYIPTTTAQVTRSADAASMTGANFSSWFNNSEGTVYSEYQTRDLGASRFAAMLAISDNTAGNRIQLSHSANKRRYVVTTSGSTQVDSTDFEGTDTSGVFSKFGVCYKVNDFVSVANGNAAVTDTLGTVPVVNRLNLGAAASGADLLNGTIRKLSFYPKRLANAELQALTQN